MKDHRQPWIMPHLIVLRSEVSRNESGVSLGGADHPEPELVATGAQMD